jgi:hypothetical protein
MSVLSDIHRAGVATAGRTLLTALAGVGVGMVIGIISVSQGLDDAQKQVLAPLSSVGTDIVVTRINGTPASSNASTTTTTPDATGGGFLVAVVAAGSSRVAAQAVATT